MGTLGLVFTVLGGLSTLGVLFRFVGKWTSRVVSELVEQTAVFKRIDTKLTGIAAATVRIEARQKQTITMLDGKAVK